MSLDTPSLDTPLRDSENPLKSRRRFLNSIGMVACVALTGSAASGAAPHADPEPEAPAQDEPPIPAGMTPQTIAEAEKLANISFTEQERDQILKSISRQLDSYELLRAAQLENNEGPAEVFDPRLPHMTFPSESHAPRWRTIAPGPLPASDVDIAFASVAALGYWIRKGQLTSERLTRIYLERLKGSLPSSSA